MAADFLVGLLPVRLNLFDGSETAGLKNFPIIEKNGFHCKEFSRRKKKKKK